MNTNDHLTAKQSTVLDGLLLVEMMARDENRPMTSAEQVETLSINLDMTKKAVDAQLRVLMTKNRVTKNDSSWAVVVDSTPRAAELDGMTDNELTWEVVVPATKPARITAHTNCSHDTSKAARAKCRRLRAKNA